MNTKIIRDDDYFTLDMVTDLKDKDSNQVRLKVHLSQEGNRDYDFLALGKRWPTSSVYIYAVFYTLNPRTTLNIGLYKMPTSKGAIGEVIGTNWEGVEERAYASAQAWYFPNERILVLWEYLPKQWIGEGKPQDNLRLKQEWAAFERFLVEQFKPFQIYTPSWEPRYAVADWQEFLKCVGFHPSPGPQTYFKNVEQMPTA